ncbi:protein RGF1 INDUCIBLE TRANSCRIPTION FACTOR 1 [Typha latifolia]|uniref:protein RGF1 INDUCIBLE TRANSCRIPTION FACTOR 1 n=1 Tax=Typha latifolia TaxID=4733 RepID=UPI003C2F0813
MVMRTVAASLVPPWLEPLLTTQFFSLCPDHADAARGECNLFCLDCSSSSWSSTAAFCFYCRSERHSDHRVIQIRRSSYHDVVRVAEVEAALDISGVQTYVINSARVVFLNERPQPRGGGASSGKASSSAHTCEICARSLLDPFRFCSLGCKLVGIKRNGDASFVEGGEAGGSGEGKNTRGRGVGEGSRRRKGIPHRAPFAS